MLRRSMARLSLSVADAKAAAAPPVVLVRVYKGSIIKSSSGSFLKSDILSEPFIGGSAAAGSIEVECEAISGGAGGALAKSNEGVKGGAPGLVEKVTRTYAELPETIVFSIGAGGASGNIGGATAITGIVAAASPGVNAVTPRDRPHGPGAGGASTSAPGGASNAAFPELRLEGGPAGVQRPDSDGRSATTPFQHGSAGGGYYVSGKEGGYGGWPGGGGGHASGSYSSGGRGGAGAARFHIYAWEPE